ncbi:MAG: 5-formyltetrahydrofolate cyclo-ligase [Flavobacteriaceae bacterium]
MDKKQLRIYYKKLRGFLTEQEKEQKSLAIANRLLMLDIWDKTYFHLFLTIEEMNEINTEYILQILMGKDKEIIISKTDFDNRKMIHYLLTENTKIKKNKYNIPEPIDGIEVPSDKIDVVFVPLLAFDKKGNRVGYGKGFYDNFLTQCKANVIKIGLSFFEPEEIIDDVFESDIPLDFCITPKEIYKFQNYEL